MKKWIYNLRDSKKLKKILYFSLLFFTFTYVFAVPSFGGRSGFNYIVYGLLIALAIVAAAYTFLYGKFSINKSLFLIPLFAIYGFIGTAIYSHDFRGWLTILLLSISFFVLYFSFRTIKNKELVFDIIILAIFLYSIYYIFHYRNEIIHFSSYGSEAFRLGTYFDNQNDVALHCIIGFSFSVYQLLFVKTKKKFIYILPAISIFVVGLTTGSRTFIIVALLLVIFFSFFRLIRRKILFLFTLLFLVVLFFILINMPFLATLRERLLKMVETFFSSSYSFDYSSVSRTIWFDYGFVLGSKNIIFGYGYAGFAIYSGVGTFTHSNVTEVFCDFGIVGLFVFYAPYLLLSIESFKKHNKNLSYLLPAFLTIIVLSFSTVFFYNKMYYIFLAICYYIVFENCFVCAESDYRDKYFSKILVVVNDKQTDKVVCDEFFGKISRICPAAKIEKIYINENNILNENNVIICKKKNIIFRSLFLYFYIRKYKYDTVFSTERKQSYLLHKVTKGFDLVFADLVTHTEVESESKKKSLPFVSINLISGEKRGTSSKELATRDYNDNDLSKLVILLKKKKYVYENTFNWK